MFAVHARDLDTFLPGDETTLADQEPSLALLQRRVARESICNMLLPSMFEAGS